MRSKRPPLTIKQILAWADAHHARTGQWPRGDTGHIPESPGDNWLSINTALGRGLRGLEGGSSLAKLLAKERGVRNVADLPPLTEAQILAWADAHHARTGAWPNEQSGPVVDASTPGETWQKINSVMRDGCRGLSGRWTLAQLLAKERGVRKRAYAPRLTVKKILRWADQHHKRTGAWPRRDSGQVDGVPGETWLIIDLALQKGIRGL